LKSKKIKILRVIARLNVGGPAIHTVLLTAALNNGSFETKLVTGSVSEQEGDMQYLAQTHGVEPHYIPSLQREISPLADLKTVWALWQVIRQFKPDIIHTHTAKAGMIGRFCAFWYNILHIKRIKVIHTFHGHVFHGYFSPLKTKFFINIERLLARLTDLIITITPTQQQEILSFGVGQKRQHKVIPLGLDLNKFYEKPRKKGFTNRNFSLPKGKMVIGTVARFVPIKNLALFLRVGRKLLDERNDIHFLMVGDGEERGQLEKLAKSLHMEKQVTFTGFLENLEEVYANLDIMMLTSNNEGSPVSIIEAMTAGVPVVASNVGGVPDLFLDSGKHLLSPPGDVAAFTQAVAFLLDNPEKAKEIAMEHKSATYQKYNISRLVNDLIIEYKNLIP